MQDPFVERLIELQHREGLSSAAFAAKLGLHPSMWHLVRHGRRRAGRKVIDGALRLYPELSYFLVAASTIRHEDETPERRREAVA